MWISILHIWENVHNIRQHSAIILFWNLGIFSHEFQISFLFLSSSSSWISSNVWLTNSDSVTCSLGFFPTLIPFSFLFFRSIISNDFIPFCFSAGSYDWSSFVKSLWWNFSSIIVFFSSIISIYYFLNNLYPSLQFFSFCSCIIFLISFNCLYDLL